MPKLTKRLIDAAKHPPSGQLFLRDDELRGFAVRITPGSKAFIVEREIHGRVRRMTIGRYGVLTVEQARDVARVKIGEIAVGRDPVEEQRQRRNSLTFGALEQLYLDRHAVHKKSASNDVGMLKKWLSEWRPRGLNTITRADVTTKHAEMGAAGHKTGANRMVALVRTMFNLAFDWGHHRGENPASRIKFFKEVKRDRFVRPDELPALWKALQSEPNPYVRGAFFLALLTGARKSEVLRMQWTDLDLRQGLWRIPDTKAGRPHTLPLPRAVVEELLKLPRLEGNPYVFCGR